MGKAGRFACIFTPMAMTIASLICLVIVLSGQAYNKSEISRGLYFFKVRLWHFFSLVLDANTRC